MSFQCEYCVNYEEDPESGESICSIDLDEDEQYCFLTHRTANCPFFRMGDEYTIVHKQI